MKRFKLLFCLSLFFNVLLSSCVNKSSTLTFNDEHGKFTSSDYLKVEDRKIMNQRGDEVLLKGTNAGGYLVLEQWMSAIKDSDDSINLDHKTINSTFLKRFGEKKTLELWEYYRNNYWTEDDFKRIKDMGMNVIRLPFTYMSVDPNYFNVKKIENQEFNFEVLDDFVSKASKYGLYTILDMHGAYGSQNGQDHSGEQLPLDQVTFYSNVELKNKTKHLWIELTKHYKNNPCVAAFDLLNEPGEKAGITTTRHFEYFDELNDAIRAVDSNRILIFESCWDGKNLPSPKTYDWNNCIYSFHNYASYTTDSNAIYQNFVNKLNEVEGQNFNLPLYMGEFTCYDKADSWNKVINLLEDRKWSYTSWTYKLNLDTEDSYKGWGFYSIFAPRVVVDKDDYETIKDKWYKVDTNYLTSKEMTLDDNTSLKDLISNFLI